MCCSEGGKFSCYKKIFLKTVEGTDEVVVDEHPAIEFLINSRRHSRQLNVSERKSHLHLLIYKSHIISKNNYGELALKRTSGCSFMVKETEVSL